MSFDQVLELLKAIVPLIVFFLGIHFKLKQDQREEVAHAIAYALRVLKEGRIDKQRAAEIILATGAVSEKKVMKVIGEIEKRDNFTINPTYKNEVIPGVGLEISPDGTFKISPEGLVNKIAHKTGKWLKRRLKRL